MVVLTDYLVDPVLNWAATILEKTWRRFVLLRRGMKNDHMPKTNCSEKVCLFRISAGREFAQERMLAQSAETNKYVTAIQFLHFLFWWAGISSIEVKAPP